MPLANLKEEGMFFLLTIEINGGCIALVLTMGS